MIWGLHFLDILVIVLYFVGMISIGYVISKRISDRDSFFLSNRGLGKVYQFFLNFGNSTNSDQAVGVAREVYRQGAGGIWIFFFSIFLTPTLWFVGLFMRRMRVTTIGDFFIDRFQSKPLAGLYAVFSLFLIVFHISFGYIVAAKTVMALCPKKESAYTVEERRAVDEYKEYKSLERLRSSQPLTGEEKERLSVLHEKAKKKEIYSFVSYIDKYKFYIAYILIVFLYTIAGGLTAATITDVFQGIIIFIFSCMLIPIGLYKIGGFSGLHEKLSPHLFEVFSSAGLGDYTWYMVLSLTLAWFTGGIANTVATTLCNAAKSEFDARFGLTWGNYLKRYMIVAWGLCGLLALGLYGNTISDPDMVWGVLTYNLLPVGLIGLMLVGIMATNMSSCDSNSLGSSALFVSNIYRPLIKGRSEKHYLLVSRIAIGVILWGWLIFAATVDNLVLVMKFFFAFSAIFGVPVWLAIFWRGITRRAVIIEAVVCIILFGVFSALFPNIGAISKWKPLLKETKAQVVTITAKATQDDVSAGKTSFVGESIEKQNVRNPVGIFFGKVVRINPDDPNSPKAGKEIFKTQLLMLHLLGFNLEEFTKADLDTGYFLVSVFFPLLLVIIFSLFTRKESEEVLNRFYAKMLTPVTGNVEQDKKEIEAGYADFSYTKSKYKLFQSKRFEVMKFTKVDIGGFGLAWVGIGIVFLFLYILMNIRWP
jgi:SSS family solute:Na+ symporter